MADQLTPGMTGNQLQISYNKQFNDYEKKLFGDSVKYAALRNTKKSIEEVREQQKASFAQRENDRINGPNAFEIQESSMGPMIPLDTTIPKGDALGEGLGDNVIGNFNQNAVTAASNTFGNQIPNSFNREMPTMQELNPDQTGMNSLYNKTI